MELPSFLAIQCVLWSIAACLSPDQHAMPSFKFGINGEPTKVDTAFGNLGEVGPQYETPPDNKTASTSGPMPDTKSTTSKTATTDPSKSMTEEHEGSNVKSDALEVDEPGFLETENENGPIPSQTFNTSIVPAGPMGGAPSTTAPAPTAATSTAPVASNTTPVVSSTTPVVSSTTPVVTTTGTPTTVSPETTHSSSAPASNTTNPNQHNSTSSHKASSSTMNQPMSSIYLGAIISIFLFYNCL